MGRRLGAIALLAMLVRAVVPAGFMLASADTPNGRYLTVQMCSQHVGPAQVIDLDTGKLVDASKIAKTDGKTKTNPGHAPCVFAASPVMAHPVAVAEPVEFLTVYEADFGVVRDVRPGRGIPAPPPPSTGPPSLI
ncbi:MAG TPA: hypothetical protein VGO52_27060 [Hyphomonadaceae bacterium]|nr:hypothetical protein [Hyphomonadaceae bacterium]